MERDKVGYEYSDREEEDDEFSEVDLKISNSDASMASVTSNESEARSNSSSSRMSVTSYRLRSATFVIKKDNPGNLPEIFDHPVKNVFLEKDRFGFNDRPMTVNLCPPLPALMTSHHVNSDTRPHTKYNPATPSEKEFPRLPNMELVSDKRKQGEVILADLREHGFLVGKSGVSFTIPFHDKKVSRNKQRNSLDDKKCVLPPLCTKRSAAGSPAEDQTSQEELMRDKERYFKDVWECRAEEIIRHADVSRKYQATVLNRIITGSKYKKPERSLTPFAFGNTIRLTELTDEKKRKQTKTGEKKTNNKENRNKEKKMRLAKAYTSSPHIRKIKSGISKRVRSSKPKENRQN